MNRLLTFLISRLMPKNRDLANGMTIVQCRGYMRELAKNLSMLDMLRIAILVRLDEHNRE